MFSLTHSRPSQLCMYTLIKLIIIESYKHACTVYTHTRTHARTHAHTHRHRHTHTLIIAVFYFGQMQQYQINKWSWNAVTLCAMHLLYDNQLSVHLHLILLKTQFTWTKWIEAEKWDQEIWETPNGEAVFILYFWQFYRTVLTFSA